LIDSRSGQPVFAVNLHFETVKVPTFVTQDLKSIMAGCLCLVAQNTSF
jgi:hypothetical protein